jgi:hypothetical protein
VESSRELPQRVNVPRFSRSARIAMFCRILQISPSSAPHNAFAHNAFDINTALYQGENNTQNCVTTEILQQPLSAKFAVDDLQNSTWRSGESRPLEFSLRILPIRLKRQAAKGRIRL